MPTSANDGGPAFPVPVSTNANGDSQWGAPGLSARDYFAASVIQGLLANPGGCIQQRPDMGWGWCNCTAEGVAEFVYQLADAMLAERDRNNQPKKPHT